MPDQESAALANPPVAPQPEPQPVPSIYDGLRVRALAAADASTGGAVSNTLAAGKNLVSQVKDIVTDPAKRHEAIGGMLLGMAGTGEFGAGEGVPEIFEGLRVRKANSPAAEVVKDDWDRPVEPTTSKTFADGTKVWTEPPSTNKIITAAEKALTERGFPKENIGKLRQRVMDEVGTGQQFSQHYAETLKDAIRAHDSKISKPIKTNASAGVTNASGESAASQEAINRVAAEKLGGVKRIRIDTRSGKESPIPPGVDAVDIHPQAHEVIVTRGPKGETLLDKGEKARYKK
jgi:hypothetical protein